MNDKTALLIIDVQLGFFENEPAVYQAEGVLNNIRMLVNKARHGGIPVVYIHRDAEPHIDGPIHPLIAPSEQDVIIVRYTPDSFHETGLKAMLDRLRVGKLIIAGFQSDVCIEATCRRAAKLGYQVSLVEDAHSTYDNLPETAAQITHQQNEKLGEIMEVETVNTVGVRFTRANRVS